MKDNMNAEPAAHALVIVDPQNDFCDKKGSLYVEGAEEDIARLAGYAASSGAAVSEIFVSLDSHDRLAVFHPLFWVDGQNKHPAPYTLISHEDFSSGRWKVASDANLPCVKKTFAAMKAGGVGAMMVWPEHCVVSTWGHQVAEPLRKALAVWQNSSGVAVRYIFKGENPYTDQFSIFEGLDSSYPETAFNESLFGRLEKFDRVTFAGEALTHCVKESILSYIRRLKSTKQKVRLLTDCSSAVTGFDGAKALDELTSAGVLPVVSAGRD